MATPYQKANAPGPDVGTAVSDPLTIANIINKSNNILLVIGVESTTEQFGDKIYADVLLDIGQKANAKIIATIGAYKYFSSKGKAEGIKSMPLLNLTDRLRDKNWINIEGKGEKYDLIVVGGFLVDFVSQALSTIKNYSEYRTISLDRYHSPNARFSPMNLEKDEWIEFMEEMISKLK
ncbi:MAG: hypothetical protein GY870_05340 [archaeon]|nr:hypothetical protein [archaeon]